MANIKNKDLPYIRRRRGERLHEVMGDMKQVDLFNAMRMRYGERVGDDYYLEGMNDVQTLSNVINGRRTLKEKPAKWAAEILKVDVNYLLGTVDDYQAYSYDDYLKNYSENAQRVLSKQELIFDKYQSMLAPSGYMLGMSAIDEEITSFDIRSKDSIIENITPGEMEQLYQEVNEFIQISVKRLRMKHPDPKL